MAHTDNLIETSRSTSRRVDGAWVRSWWAPLVIFAGIGACVWIAVWWGNVHLPHDSFFPRRPGIAGGTVFEGWQRWDAEWYRTIIRDGYVYYPRVQSSVAFWPSYPVVVKAFTWMFPSVYITGSMVTLACGAIVAVVFNRWARVFVAPSIALMAVALLCVYPYSYYLYGAIYADALFVAATIGAFLLVERDRMFWAGVVGIIASAGRPAGMVVALVLVLRVLERRNIADGPVSFLERFDPRRARRSDLPVLLSFAGVGAWCAYLWVRFGDPFLFITIEQEWSQGAGPSTWLKFQLINDLQHHATWPSTIGNCVQAVLVTGCLLLVPLVKRRFGWAYALYVLGIVALPLIGTKDFMGGGRYLLGAFPCFVVAAELLVRRRRVGWAVLGTSFVALLVLAALFGRGSYIS